MLRSDAEDFLKRWSFVDKKVFLYKYPLAPDEYVVFSRDRNNDVYMAHHGDSTYKMKDLDFNEFARLLIIGELRYLQDHNWGTNAKNMKTGGCNCGSWILRDNEYMHDVKCPRYKRTPV